ncbi:MAG TPA: tetratricopeptide repeat protein [Candidatus Cloacimonetes bacterium]|nr:tetratricopeptide repeat protein [Candidatus Cloacimonadota bacterium]
MISKDFSKKISIVVLTFITLFLISEEIPGDKVLAEFDGGQITMSQLEERINNIPPFYQSRYKTEEGKISLLDMMCTEELFYLEAVAAGLENDEDVNMKSDTQIKSTLSRMRKQDLIENEFIITEEEKHEYFIQNQDKFPGKTYEEAISSVEAKLRNDKQKDFLDKKKAEFFEKYNVVIDTTVIESINIKNIDENEAILDEQFVFSSEPRMEKNVALFIDYFKGLPPQRQETINSPEKLKEHINELVETDVFYFDALEQGFDKKEDAVDTIEQTKKTVMLRTVYNQLVVDKLDLGDDKIREFYDNNLDKFSSKPYRKIQAFYFDKEDKANDVLKKVEKAVKKENEDSITKLIEENSIHPEKNGILDYIYQNGIVPGIGKDEIYSQKIWETDPDQMSEVFKNSKDEFVFFRILEDHPADPQPFEEIKEKIKMSMTKDLAKTKFEEVTKEFEVKYNLKKYPDRLVIKLTPEEYFTKAENAQKNRRYQDAIFYYDKVMKYYPNNTDDYKAMFMKAFLYAEEMNKQGEAIKLFEEFLEKYPEGDLHESARFMTKELKGESNLFDEIEASDK